MGLELLEVLLPVLYCQWHKILSYWRICCPVLLSLFCWTQSQNTRQSG